MKRFSLILLAGTIALAGLFATRSPSAAADAWPQRTVRFILPLGAGSGSDIGARLFADRLSARWGHPVVVENRPGGDGFVAINAFISAHDDHTLLFAPTSTFTAHPILHSKVPYDRADMVPIARVTNTLIALSVAPALFAVVYFLTRRIKRASRAVRKSESELTSIVEEALTSARVVKAFAREDYEIQRFESESLENVEIALRARALKARLAPIVSMIDAKVCSMWRTCLNSASLFFHRPE